MIVTPKIIILKSLIFLILLIILDTLFYYTTDVVLNVLSDLGEGIKIESCELTEKRMYIKAINQRLELEVKPGDPVQAGICVSNSEIGLGSLSVEPLIFRLVCTNNFFFII